MSDLTVNINASNNTSPGVNSALNSLRQLENAASAVSDLVLSITVPPVVGAAAAYQQFLQLDEARTKAMIAGDYDTKDMDALAISADKLSEKFAKSRSEIYDMFAQLGKSGVAVQGIESVSESIVKLSALTDNLSANEAFDAINVAAKNFGLSIENDGNKIASLYNSLDDLGTGALTTIPRIADAFSQVGGIGKQVGLTMEEVGSMLINLMDSGDAQAGIHTRSILQSFSSLSENGKFALESMGITMNDIFSGGKLNLDIFNLINEKFTELNVSGEQKLSILTEIFGKNAASAAAAYIDMGDTISETMSKLDADGETMARQMGQMQESAAFQAQQAWILLQNAIEEVGAAMQPLVAQYLPEVVAYIKEWTEWLKDPANAAFIANLIKISAEFAAIALAIKTTITVIGTLRTAVLALTGAYATLTATAKGAAAATALTSGAALAVGAAGTAAAGAGLAAYDSATSSVGKRNKYNYIGRAGDWYGTMLGGGSLEDANRAYNDYAGKEDTTAFKTDENGELLTSVAETKDNTYAVNENLTAMKDNVNENMIAHTEGINAVKDILTENLTTIIGHLSESKNYLSNLTTLSDINNWCSRLYEKQNAAYLT